MTDSKDFPQDPCHVQQQDRYESPISSRSHILLVLQKLGRPATLAQLAKLVALRNDSQKSALSRRLDAMVRDRQLRQDRQGRYHLPAKASVVQGKVLSHRDGFGFLQVEGQPEDVFLPPKTMQLVMHGDEVIALVLPDRGRSGKQRSGRYVGRIIDIIHRAHAHLVGRVHRQEKSLYVVPDDPRLNMRIEIEGGGQGKVRARPGQIVEVQITAYPDRQTNCRGRITEILGEHLGPGMEIDIALRNHEIPFVWDDDVLAELERIPEHISTSEIKRRKDLRSLPFVTIDGEDARDFDDAVYCEREGRGWILWVAIADVASYVMAGSALDRAATDRGTSVYFPGRVIPMLPEKLSNGLCSLKPNVDRLSLVCQMHVSPRGEVRSYQFFASVIRSHARLTYHQANDLLKNGQAQSDLPFMKSLQELERVYQALDKNRISRGALRFDREEVQIVFGDDQKIEKIVPVERLRTHEIIEVCMIAANVCAADYLEDREMPFLFRVHEAPKTEKLEGLKQFLREIGLTLGGGDQPEPRDFSRLLDAISERDDRITIETVVLRSQNQAFYSPDNQGHFGLALSHYAHFTSPIRRYPDLLVHRAIHHCLDGKGADSFPYTHADMKALGEHCSMTERRADEATRDVISWLKCFYLQQFLGKCFQGVITGVAEFGLFVELQPLYAEGLIHVSALPKDFYRFIPEKQVLTGTSHGRTFKLMQHVHVRLARVDLESRKIDLTLYES
ncbi:MAG: ribonuclease R [Gammaproteobacteria bacterium]|nr:MAG: ribonuclease R [Gammaproteobacteria bacterium]